MLESLFGCEALGMLPPAPVWGDSGRSLRLKAFSGTKIKLSSSQPKPNDKTVLLKVYFSL